MLERETQQHHVDDQENRAPADRDTEQRESANNRQGAARSARFRMPLSESHCGRRTDACLSGFGRDDVRVVSAPGLRGGPRRRQRATRAREVPHARQCCETRPQQASLQDCQSASGLV